MRSILPIRLACNSTPNTPEQLNTLALCGLAATAFVHQHAALQRLRQIQRLRFPIVEISRRGGVDGIIAAGMNLRMGVHEGNNVGSARTRAVRCGLVQHDLRNMDSMKDSDKQFQLTTTGQGDQGPGIGNDNGPTHCSVSKAASSCASSLGA